MNLNVPIITTQYFRRRTICTNTNDTVYTPVHTVTVQCINMTSGAVFVCNGLFYDSGGPNGNYSNNENNTFTVYPSTQ